MHDTIENGPVEADRSTFQGQLSDRCGIRRAGQAGPALIEPLTPQRPLAYEVNRHSIARGRGHNLLRSLTGRFDLCYSSLTIFV